MSIAWQKEVQVRSTWGYSFTTLTGGTLLNHALLLCAEIDKKGVKKLSDNSHRYNTEGGMTDHICMYVWSHIVRVYERCGMLLFWTSD